MSKTSKYVPLAVAAERYGIHPRTIRRRIADGTLTGYRVASNKTLRVDLDECDAVLVRPVPAVGGAA